MSGEQHQMDRDLHVFDEFLGCIFESLDLRSPLFQFLGCVFEGLDSLLPLFQLLHKPFSLRLLAARNELKVVDPLLVLVDHGHQHVPLLRRDLEFAVIAVAADDFGLAKAGKTAAGAARARAGIAGAADFGSIAAAGELGIVDVAGIGDAGVDVGSASGIGSAVAANGIRIPTPEGWDVWP
jgi:hypothetical protein